MSKIENMQRLMENDDFNTKTKTKNLDELNDLSLIEKKGIINVTISCIIFGLTSFHIKLTKNTFEEKFDSNLFMFWRSLSCSLLTLAIVYKNSDRIVNISEIKTKNWFYIRAFGNYFSIISLILCMLYLRAATASCMSSMSPALVIIFSIFILGEKFHIRYLIGIIICFIGTAMIVLNEKKAPGHEDIKTILIIDEETENIHLLTGAFFGLSHLVFNALLAVAQKILAAERIPLDSVCFYIGLSNSVMALIVSIFTNTFSLDLYFAFFSALNGIVFYYSVYYLNEGMKYIDLSKTTPFFYLSTLTVFFLGVFFLGEVLYFTDILGSLLILSYNLYNSYVPLK